MARIVFVAAVLAALVAAVPAHAASPFSFPFTVSPPDSGLGEARMNASGDAAVVWGSGRGAASDQGKVEGVTAPAGADFSAVQPLASGNVRAPRVALDDDGRLAAVWTAGTSVGLATGAVPGGFGPAATFQPPYAMATAVGSAGQAVAVWADRSGAGQSYTRVRAAYRPAGGGFGAAITLAEQAAVDPHIAVEIDPASTVVVAWRAAADRSGPHRAWAVTIPAGGRPAPPMALSGPGDDVRAPPSLHLGPRGDVAASWYAASAGAPPTGSRIAVRAASGAFGAPEAVAEGAAGVRVAFDRAGAALAAWSARARRGARTAKVVRISRRPPGGAFGPAEDIAAPRLYPGSQRPGLDGRGNAIVAWSEEQAGRVRSPVLLAAVQRPGGRFGLPTTLARRATPETLVFDAFDGGLLLGRRWTNGTVLGVRYLARLLDAGGPAVLDDLEADPRRRRLRFWVNEPGRAVVLVERARCRGCVRFRRLSRRSVAVRRGLRTLSLTAPRGGRLAPGDYRMIVRAHDLTGRRLAVRRLAFRVDRRAPSPRRGGG